MLAGADVERATPAEIDLTAAVRTAVDLASPGFARHEITVTTDLAPNVAVRARMDEISQVLANLLQNAMRYTPAGGSVAVELIGIRRDGRGDRQGHQHRLGNTGK